MNSTVSARSAVTGLSDGHSRNTKEDERGSVGTSDIFFGGCAAGRGGLLPLLFDPRIYLSHLLALLDEQSGGHRAVHAAAHGHNDAIFYWLMY